MTGAQAWSIISPILEASWTFYADRYELREAYVIAYCALTDYDKHKTEGKEE